jgi:hypothetical protein
MYPFEFALLYRLGQAPHSTAAQIAVAVSQGHPFVVTGVQVAARLRRLINIGLVEHDGIPPAAYRLTEAGREYVDA